MHEAAAPDAVERLAHGPLDADAVDLAHRVDAHARLAQEPALALVERADADQRDASGVDRWQRPRVALEPGAARGRAPRRAASRGRSRSGSSRACWRRNARPPRARRRRRGQRRDRRASPALPSGLPRARAGSRRAWVDSATSAAIRSHVSLIWGRNRACSSTSVGLLRLGARDVAEVAHLVPEAADALLETGGPHRRRPHVDATPALAEVERGADDRHVAFPDLGHGAERYAIFASSGPRLHWLASAR